MERWVQSEALRSGSGGDRSAHLASLEMGRTAENEFQLMESGRDPFIFVALLAFFSTHADLVAIGEKGHVVIEMTDRKKVLLNVAERGRWEDMMSHSSVRVHPPDAAAKLRATVHPS